MNFENNSFDGIWCSAALIHAAKDDLNKILKIFFKILKKNGVLGIIVRRIVKRVPEKEDKRVFTMFYKNELEKNLKKAGFKTIFSKIFSHKKMKWIFIISKRIR